MYRNSRGVFSQSVVKRLKQNDKIVGLIKAKLQPMNKFKVVKKSSPLPLIQSKSSKKYKSLHCRKRIVDIPLVETENYHTLQHQQSKESILLKRAKTYIKEEYKKINDKENKGPSKLSQYIKMFELSQVRPNETRKNRKRTIFREIQSGTKKYIPFVTQKKISENEATLRNARLRKKLNHKKMIQMYKFF